VYRQGIKAGVVLLALVGVVAVAAPAGGAKFRQLGKVAPKVGAGDACGDCDAFQFSTAPASPSYVVPKGKWTIVSWKAAGLKNDVGHARLRIFRPTGVNDQFEIVTESDKERFPAGKVKEHDTRLRVRKGDHLGISSVGDMATSYDTNKFEDITGGASACSGVGDTVGPMGSGSTCTLSKFEFSRTNVAVTLKRR
jgi:hypothetical protein